MVLQVLRRQEDQDQIVPLQLNSIYKFALEISQKCARETLYLTRAKNQKSGVNKKRRLETGQKSGQKVSVKHDFPRTKTRKRGNIAVSRQLFVARPKKKTLAGRGKSSISRYILKFPVGATFPVFLTTKK